MMKNRQDIINRENTIIKQCDTNITAVLSATREERRKIMNANISFLKYIARNLIAGGWTSKDAKEIQLEYNLSDDELNAIVEIMEEMENKK